ncbi:glutamine amidotransferase-related protein [Saccharospirillum mangrovi]|uniref:glutamine amidotransferase-related protein n=1 Tax=Saccharospirillum mangrovi TaxID=2161747 RepID=UPI000D3A6C78|nr:gamma-glutamyl-gamma-aminobutyrate hydrolase family protein [Saccharospirillum mangrovi]
MKVAILETDVLRDNLKPTYVGYGRMFQDLFGRVGADWDMPIFSVINGEYPATIDDFDAYLITGSKHDAFADDDWIVRLRDYSKQLFEAGKPLLGICFGHQLLAHTLGGRAERADAGWGLGVMQYEMHEQPDFIVNGENGADTNGTVGLLVSHRDQVTELPPGAKRLLSNGFCPLAAFYIPGQVLCFQGHPEFNKDYERALLEYRQDDVSREQMQRIEASLTDEHEGERIGRWMKQFLEQAAR